MTDIALPNVHIDGRTVEKMVDEVIRDWKRIRPWEAKGWKALCDKKRANLYADGWSKERHLFIPVVYPAFVLLRLQRMLGKNDLNEREHRALLRVLPCCRMTDRVGLQSSVLTEADTSK